MNPPENMPVSFSFGISNDDIEFVFERHIGVKANEELVCWISNMLDHDAIAMVAIKASTDMDEQTAAAYEEIERQLDEIEKLYG